MQLINVKIFLLSTVLGIVQIYAIEQEIPLKVVERLHLSQCMRFPTMWHFGMCRLG